VRLAVRLHIFVLCDSSYISYRYCVMICALAALMLLAVCGAAEGPTAARAVDAAGASSAGSPRMPQAFHANFSIVAHLVDRVSRPDDAFERYTSVWSFGAPMRLAARPSIHPGPWRSMPKGTRHSLLHLTGSVRTCSRLLTTSLAVRGSQSKPYPPWLRRIEVWYDLPSRKVRCGVRQAPQSMDGGAHRRCQEAAPSVLLTAGQGVRARGLRGGQDVPAAVRHEKRVRPARRRVRRVPASVPQ
jgi:hypothetical protein